MKVVNLTESFSDEELVSKFKRGDEMALLALISKHKGLIIKTCNSFYLKRWDNDDLFQEGMIAFLKAIKSYAPELNKGKAFGAFAKNIIYLHMIGVLRKHTRCKHQVLNLALPLEVTINNEQDVCFDVLSTYPSANAPNPIDVVVEKEFLEEFNNFIKYNLTALESEVLYLYLDDYTYKQIATRLGIATKSVDNTIARVKKKLKMGLFEHKLEIKNVI